MVNHAQKQHRWVGVAARAVLASTLAAASVAVYSAPAGAAVSPTAEAIDLAAAMKTPSTTLAGVSFVELPPEGTPNAVVNSPLGGFPTQGGSFAVLTTGDANLADDPNDAEDSAGFDGGEGTRGNTAYDVTVLKIGVSVPQGANCLRFDFRFFSEEFEEYVGSEFNDAFIAELDASTWTTNDSEIDAPGNFAFDPAGQPISINAAGVTSMTEENAAGTTYDGATPLLTAATTVDPGVHSLFLSIFDQGDDDYDSAVFLDNLVVGFAPNPQTQCTPGAQVKQYNVQLTPSSLSVTLPGPATLTAKVTTVDPAGPVTSGTLLWTRSGTATESGASPIQPDGTVPLSFTGTTNELDTVTACFDVDNSGVCDSGEPTASATIAWFAPVDENQPPVNNVGGPYSGTAGVPIALSGTASDPDGDALTNTWDYNGPGTCTFGDVHALVTTITCDTAGLYVVGLVTTDGTESVADDIEMPVAPAEGEEPSNHAPTNDAGGPYVSTEDNAVSIDGSANDVDEDALTHTWSSTGPGACTFGDEHALETSVTCDTVGEYVLTLTTSDGTESAVASAELTILAVGGGNIAPANDAHGPYSGTVDGPVTLAGTAFDLDEDELTNTWSYDGPGECAFSDEHALDSTVTCDTAGQYTLTLTTDDGEESTLDTAPLTIGAPEEPTLPKTGSGSSTFALTGLLLIAAGAAVLTIGRRRRGSIAS